MTYPSFTTTITIQPGDERHCGECRQRANQMQSMLPMCMAHDTELMVDLRCPACLADEREARERPRMLIECPECHGDPPYETNKAHDWDYPVPCPGCKGQEFGVPPGWVEVPR